MTRLLEIMKAIGDERRHQDEKYGPVLSDSPGFEYTQGPGGHELGTWLIVIEKELNEAKDAATGAGRREKTGRNSVRAEILQIAAVCCAALEQHGLEGGS